MEEEHPLRSPKRLRTLASTLEYPGGNSLLHKVVEANLDPNPSQSASYIRLILLSMSGVDVNAVNDEGCTALYLAVMRGNLLTVRMMLTCLPDIDVNKIVQSPIPKTALHLAVELHDLPMVQELLEKGADVNKAYKNRHTPIEVAVRECHLDTLRLILDRARDINVDNLLLFAAQYSCSKDIVQFLLQKGADVNAKDVCGLTSLHYAADNGNLILLKFLMSKGANHHASIPISSHNLCFLKFLLNRGVDVDMVKSLNDAAYCDRADTVRFLVEKKGADVNTRGVCDYSPLLHAVISNNLPLTRWLLQRGADVNQADVTGLTPLHSAAERKYLCILKALLERGADRNARDSQGNTPFDVASDAECRRILQHH